LTTPYPAPPPHSPYPPQAAPAPKKRRWLVPSLIGGGIALALCCGGAIAASLAGGEPKTSGDATDAAAGTASDKPVADGPKKYRIGQPVRGGDFEFVVRGHKCGIAEVGDPLLARKAQGTFCRTDITVKNVTKKAKLFHADSTVTAQDATGREFDADGEANVYGNSNGAGFLDEINPGNEVRAFVYFDVPSGTKLATITFDAGLFSVAEDAVVTL
jgi:Domain of unknown function (DUF4352)